MAQRRLVLRTLVQRDLKVRYADSLLGWVWTILDPLLMSTVYFVVFTFILQVHRKANEPYFFFLIIGLLVWQWFNTTVLDSTRALNQEAQLVRSTNIPRELWVLRVVVAKFIEFALAMPVLAGFLIYYLVTGAVHLNWQLVYIPLAVILQFLLLIGVGLILAPLNVIVTDTQRFVRILLRFYFYVSPILWAVHAVPAALRPVVVANPMTGILDLYRAGFFPVTPDWSSVAVAAVMSVVVFFAGMVVFGRLERPVLKEI